MLKSLHKDDTQIIPFVVTKDWNLSNVTNEDCILMEHGGVAGLPVAVEYLDFGPDSSSVAVSQCNIAEEHQHRDLIRYRDGLKVSGIFYPDTDPLNLDGTYQRVVYSQIVNMFYNSYQDPTKMWGLEQIDFEKSQTKKFVADKFKMFEIPQGIFGETVIKNSIVLYENTTDNDYIITDDGNCNLFAEKNLFSRQQEVGKYANEFITGSLNYCDYYEQLNPPNPLSGRLVADIDGVEPWDIDIPDQASWDISYGGYSYVSMVDCTTLDTLYCYYNSLSTLDVSTNTALTYLNCQANSLTSLDLSSNTILSTLYCNYNSITSLTIGTNLGYIVCSNNALDQTSVDGILAQSVASGITIGYLDLSGGTNAAPSDISVGSDYDILTSDRGWTVNIN